MNGRPFWLFYAFVTLCLHIYLWHYFIIALSFEKLSLLMLILFLGFMMGHYMLSLYVLYRLFCLHFSLFDTIYLLPFWKYACNISIMCFNWTLRSKTLILAYNLPQQISYLQNLDFLDFTWSFIINRILIFHLLFSHVFTVSIKLYLIGLKI